MLKKYNKYLETPQQFIPPYILSMFFALAAAVDRYTNVILCGFNIHLKDHKKNASLKNQYMYF